MITIPMNTRPPKRLGETAADMRVQAPLGLGEIRQAGTRPSANRGQAPVNRAQAAPFRPPVNHAQTAPSQAPVNRAQTAPSRPLVNRGQAVPPQAPVNRAQAAPPQAPTNRAQAVPPQAPVNRAQAVPPQAAAPAGILPGIRPGLLMKKGQKAPLQLPSSGLPELQVCLGWRVKDARCEMDASAFLLGADGKAPGEEWFVFYGQTASPEGSVSLREGRAGEETVFAVSLGRVKPGITRIAFILTIHEALQQRLHFGMAADAYIRVVDKGSGTELVRFVLEEYYSNVTSMIVGELYEKNSQWRFNAVGNGVAKDLPGLCGFYGIEASY